MHLTLILPSSFQPAQVGAACRHTGGQPGPLGWKSRKPIRTSRRGRCLPRICGPSPLKVRTRPGIGRRRQPAGRLSVTRRSLFPEGVTMIVPYRARLSCWRWLGVPLSLVDQSWRSVGAEEERSTCRSIAPDNAHCGVGLLHTQPWPENLVQGRAGRAKNAGRSPDVASWTGAVSRDDGGLSLLQGSQIGSWTSA